MDIRYLTLGCFSIVGLILAIMLILYAVWPSHTVIYVEKNLPNGEIEFAPRLLNLSSLDGADELRCIVRPRGINNNRRPPFVVEVTRETIDESKILGPPKSFEDAVAVKGKK